MNRLLAQIKSIIYFFGKDSCRYLLVTNESGSIQSSNKEMSNPLDQSAEEMKKKNFFDFLSACQETTFERIDEFFQRAIPPGLSQLILKDKSDRGIICQLRRLFIQQSGKGLFLCPAYLSKQEAENKINDKNYSPVDDSVSASLSCVIVPAFQKKILESANGIKHVIDLHDAGRWLPEKENKKM